MEGTNRRDFLKYIMGSAVGLYGLDALAVNKSLLKKDFKKLTVLYTNDQHSRIESFPGNDPKYPDMGGFAKRAAIIEKIREEEKNVLLLDAGDIFQGTPYFNYFEGELEYKLMSMMQYDATTFGNHDFDLGCENLVKQMPHANFDFMNCNYNFNDSILHKHPQIKAFKIFRKGGIKIGVLGVGIDLKNLVSDKLVGGVQYQDPVSQSDRIAAYLKKEERCDLVICLSHLGYSYNNSKISDKILASQSENIDLIIGGHTHTFLKEPDLIKNKMGIDIPVTQVGWAGIWLGKINYYFSPCGKWTYKSCENHPVL
ncbi:MAG: metallophosphatase [Sphingobacteriaceae bacterium]|nr:metallophosphatase [Sphingobacteriaceae bacterium]